jgi:hypothetical protein
VEHDLSEGHFQLSGSCSKHRTLGPSKFCCAPETHSHANWLRSMTEPGQALLPEGRGLEGNLQARV